ncbi:MAG: SPOR domain-containing protein [Gammaproteobacteria bacterium]|nr:SPOR domain-containing protein [Gammaproteobacteria bacterium]
MDKSQLRILAGRYAKGDLDTDAYLSERKALIDRITDRTEAIERAAHFPLDVETPLFVDTPAEPETNRWPVIATAAVVILALGIGFAWRTGEDAPSVPVETVTRADTPTPATSPADALPPRIDATTRARALSAQLIIDDDWSAERIRDFADQWMSLPPNIREHALAADWFQAPLGRLALRLHSDSPTGAELATDETLTAFWNVLNLEAPPAQSAEEIAMRESAAEPGENGSGAAHATVLQPAAPSPPETRASEREAETVSTVASLEPAPIPQSMSQSTSHSTSDDHAESLDNPPARQTPATQASSPDVELFTLQIFASGQRDNASRLIDSFPELGLRLREVAVPGSRYRVVYGIFPSEAAARTAVRHLPAQVTKRTGAPIVRAIAELDRLKN